MIPRSVVEQSSLLREGDPKVGLFAIVKDEAPYIEEWLAHHLAAGCTQIFIADNGSTDGCRERLEALQQRGFCRVIDFMASPDRAPQLPAYRELATRFGHEVDWMAFVDADEFIITDDAFESIADFVSLFHTRQEVGAIALNWACFGSSGRTEYEDDLVVRRFPRRADQNAFINHHYKSIVRSAAFAGPGKNPHHFELMKGFSYVTSDGSPLRLSAQKGAGLSAEVVWTNARINHYVVKSRQEFFEKKAPRGQAAVVGKKRTESFFIGHDRNEVHEPFPQPLLQRLVKAHSNIINSPPLHDLNYSFDDAEKPAKQSGFGEGCQRKPFLSVVDIAERKGMDLCIKGWAISPEDGPAPLLEVRSVNGAVETRIVRMPRPDVLRCHPDASGDVGFLITVSLLEPDLVTSSPIEIWSGSSRLSRIQVPADLQWSPDTLPALNQPAMPAPCIERLKNALNQSGTYLEYGSGGSTLLAAQNPGLLIISVESNWKILRSVKLSLAHLGAVERSVLHFIDLGSVRENGFPEDLSTFPRWHHYAISPWMHCREKDISPDTVLIDGRFRRACIIASLIFSRSGTRILFDDYFNRDHYHSIEKHISPTASIDRMAEFIRPPSIDAAALWIDLLEAVGDPR